MKYQNFPVSFAYANVKLAYSLTVNEKSATTVGSGEDWCTWQRCHFLFIVTKKLIFRLHDIFCPLAVTFAMPKLRTQLTWRRTYQHMAAAGRKQHSSRVLLGLWPEV